MTTWMVILAGTAHAQQPFWNAPLTPNQVRAVFGVTGANPITDTVAQDAFLAMYGAHGVGPLATYDAVTETTVGLAFRSAEQWGFVADANDEKFIYCRDDAACDRVRQWAATPAAAPHVTTVGAGAATRLFFDADGYVCLLDVLFRDGPSNGVCEATWGDLVKHAYLQQNNVVAQRDVDMTIPNANPLGTQQRVRVSVDWESWANEALFRWASIAWATQNPGGNPSYLDSTMPDTTFNNLFSGCSNTPTNVYDRMYGLTTRSTAAQPPGLGLPGAVGAAIATQIGGPNVDVEVLLDCDPYSPNYPQTSVLPAAEARDRFGLRANVTGAQLCTCGSCVNLAGATYDRDMDLEVRLGVGPANGSRPRWKVTCAELEHLVVGLTTEPSAWTVSGGDWSWAIGDGNANHRPTYGEVLAFLLATGNALPNLDDAPFADVVPWDQLQDLNSAAGLTTNKEMDFQERVMDLIMNLP